MNTTPLPFKKCARFNRCACNKCPLDPEYPRRETHPDDPETVCKLAKSRRIAIGSKYPDLLPYGGMTTREFSAKKRYENLTPEERAQMAAAGKKALLSLRGKIPPQNGTQVPPGESGQAKETVEAAQ
jgi:hypothetical protein